MSLPVKTQMAIFGMNGLYAAALYFGGIFLLYGTKNSGFVNVAEMEDWWRVKARKAAAQAGGDPSGIKAAYAEERQKVARALGDKTPKGFVEKQWAR